MWMLVCRLQHLCKVAAAAAAAEASGSGVVWFQPVYSKHAAQPVAQPKMANSNSV